MRTTLKDIQSLYPEFRVSQIDSKQMFVVYKTNPLLLSYRTIVGIKLNDTWYITLQKYSQATTKQIKEFLGYSNRFPRHQFIPQNQLEYLLQNN